MNNLNSSNLSGLNNAYLDNLIVVNNFDAYNDISGSTLFGIPNYYFTNLTSPIQQQFNNLISISGVIPTFSIGSTTSTTASPSVSLSKVASNYAFNFTLQQGPTGLTGATGPSGSNGKDAAGGLFSGSSGGGGGGGGSDVLGPLIEMIISLAGTVAIEYLSRAFGVATLASLEAEIIALQLQVFQLTGYLSLAQAEITEMQVNIGALETAMGVQSTLIEQLQAKILYVGCVPSTTNIDSQLIVFNPFGTSTIWGNLQVNGNLTVSNPNISSTGLSQF